MLDGIDCYHRWDGLFLRAKLVNALTVSVGFATGSFCVVVESMTIRVRSGLRLDADLVVSHLCAV